MSTDRKESSVPLVLAVDDDLTTRLLMGESLRGAGFDVAEAEDGAAAVEKFKELQPDMVLLDVVMPNMDGFEACAAIRALPGGERVPILMATGLEDVDSVHRAYELGATDFITKPINWSLLSHRVRYMLRSAGTHQQLLVSEAKNTALLDGTPDAMIRYRRGGEILEAKLSDASPVTVDARDLPGADIDTIMPDEFKGQAVLLAAQALDQGKAQLAEFHMESPTFPTRHFEARVVVSGEEEALAIIRDITERKRMEESLRESEERFRSLIENASDLITLLDQEGVVLYESPAVSRILGFESDTLVGQNVMGMTHEEDRDTLRSSIQAAVEGSEPLGTEQIRVLDQNGAYKVMEIVCAPFDDASARARVVMNSRDVTDRLEAERALRESEEQLRQSQKMEAIGRLAGGVAHDFNNLLTAILGYGQMLEERLLAEGDSVEEAQEIRKAATRATSLTRQLLAFSRKQVLQTREVNLNSTVAEMEKMLNRLLGEDVELETRIDEGLHVVNVDPGQMEQVIMNLAVNARDAMPSGGRLVIETSNIVVDTALAQARQKIEPGSYVMLSVTDTGIGMDSETLSRIFEPFFTTKEQGRGTGLGLSTVYGIVNQSEGDLWVESSVGEGTTFKILIPACVPEVVAIPQPEPTHVELKGSATILLIEDEAWVRSLVKKCLQRYGYTVIVADDGQHALEICEGFKGKIDLMLTDVVMPRMNGVELAEHMMETRPEMRIIFMSGYTEHALFKNGVLDMEKSFLQKPFTLEAVAQKVKEALSENDDLPAPHAQVG